VFKIGLSICAAILLAGCGAPQTRPAQNVPGEPATSPAVGALPTPPSGVPVYRIDGGHSEIRLLVYRAGPMAKFGHNHVMVNDAVSGWVAATDGVQGASLSLRVPVADFVVDAAEARAAEGADFSEEVAGEARDGTRHNMLSETCLDGDRYPSITLTSRSVTMVEGKPIATLVVNVAGHESTLVVPFMLTTSPDRLSGSGTFVLRQSDLGLVPFSILLGALQVQNDITVKFNLVAVKS
jgi:YceI-like domain